MDTKQRIRANSPAEGLVVTAILGCALGGHFFGIFKLQIPYLLVFVFGFFLCLLATLYYIFNPRYLSDEGVEILHWGCRKQILPWDQIAHICLIRDFRYSVYASSQPRIVFIPVGCELYDKEKWNGLFYFIKYRHLVIPIDYTKTNLNFIKQHHSDIQDLS